MKKTIIIIGFLLLCANGIHAQKLKRIVGSGNVVSITRTTDDYDGLDVGGFFDIELVAGEEGNITLNGEDNILEQITTEVRNGILTIKPMKNRNLRPSVKSGVSITIPVEAIDELKISGAGKFVSKKILKARNLKIRVSGSRNVTLGLESESLMLRISGSNNVQLKGTAQDLDVHSSGSSNCRGYELEVDYASFQMSGSSNVEITVHESLSARTSGSSNVRYRGSPSRIQSKTSGSSNVIAVHQEY
ncbi:MAG: DUF2807 domain-containing protein [Flavobacteriaceae bacterium]|nr:MAG: DUF2807 domain-containing protein [Flavobacteriaceae bacterium]